MDDKRRIKGQERRKIIIDAAIKCIATRGLCDTTLDKVGDIAKVSRTLVVFHFKSKKEMLSVVLEEIAAEYHHQWESIKNKSNNKPPEIQLIQLIKYDLELPIKKPDLISVWHTFWGEAKGLYREFNAARDDKYSEDLTDLLKKIARNGGYKNANPGNIATGLESMILGFWWTAHINPNSYNSKRNMKIIRSYLELNFPNQF